MPGPLFLKSFSVRPRTLETLAQVLSREFSEIFKNAFFTEHLRATAYVTYPR